MREALDMANAAGEIMGYFGDLDFRPKAAGDLKTWFNARRSDPDDPFAPEMSHPPGRPGRRRPDGLF